MYAALMSGMLASCSNDDLNGPDGSKGEPVTSYLSVSIVAPTGTKAGETTDYEDGLDVENKVSSIRFYFFDNAGNPVNVKAGNGTRSNYYEPTTFTDGVNKDTPNVSNIVDAQVVINSESGDLKPDQMIAVVNPPASLKNEDGSSWYTVEQLKTKVMDFTDYTADNKFPMINSVYSSASGVEFANKVSDYIKDSQAAALATPVEVYVERCVAKVSVSLDFTALGADKQGADGSILVVPADGGYGQKIYFKPTGWNVACEAGTTTLGKDIADFVDGDFDFVWNYAPFHRSFWAKNATGMTLEWNNGYDKLNKDFTNDFVYVNENTPSPASATCKGNDDSTILTKVVVGGTICDESGNAIPLVRFNGSTWTKDQLTTAVLQYMQNSADFSDIYVKETNEGSTTYRSLTAADIAFTTATVAENIEGTEMRDGKRYFVYPSLKAGQNYTSSDAENSPVMSDVEVKAINTKLKTYGKASIYENGMSYYYLVIRHLAPVESTKAGVYGVVRNHVYKCTINSIEGIGTPVYDPTEVIYPEKPKDSNYYMGAKINVLSWRIVNNNYNIKF